MWCDILPIHPAQLSRGLFCDGRVKAEAICPWSLVVASSCLCSSSMTRKVSLSRSFTVAVFKFFWRAPEVEQLPFSAWADLGAVHWEGYSSSRTLTSMYMSSSSTTSFSLSDGWSCDDSSQVDRLLASFTFNWKNTRGLLNKIKYYQTQLINIFHLIINKNAILQLLYINIYMFINKITFNCSLKLNLELHPNMKGLYSDCRIYNVNHYIIVWKGNMITHVTTLSTWYPGNVGGQEWKSVLQKLVPISDIPHRCPRSFPG